MVEQTEEASRDGRMETALIEMHDLGDGRLTLSEFFPDQGGRNRPAEDAHKAIAEERGWTWIKSEVDRKLNFGRPFRGIRSDGWVVWTMVEGTAVPLTGIANADTRQDS